MAMILSDTARQESRHNSSWREGQNSIQREVVNLAFPAVVFRGVARSRLTWERVMPLNNDCGGGYGKSRPQENSRLKIAERKNPDVTLTFNLILILLLYTAGQGRINHPVWHNLLAGLNSIIHLK